MVGNLAEEAASGEIEGNKAAGLDDHPIAGQVIGTNPDEMAKGALILSEMGYDMIDVNLACPVKKIRRRNPRIWVSKSCRLIYSPRACDAE